MRAASIASLPSDRREAFLRELSPEALSALPYLFEFWAHDHQRPPAGDWTTWLALGGRGAGKTRAGSEWVRAQVEGATPLAGGRARRVALIAETWEQAREVMVFGESGIMACSPPDRRPSFHAGRQTVIWPNGAEARLFSAVDPESLRGPQFDRAWSDELAKWRRGEAAWDNLQMGLRLGDRPRQVVTTTPRDTPLLRRLLVSESVAVTRAPTRANKAFLARGFLDEIARAYAGSAWGRQEIEGELLVEREDALFPRRIVEAARIAAHPDLERIVVAVDPPASSGESADECGIVVAGRAGEVVYVLADLSIARAAPAHWAERVVRAWRLHEADRIVAEANQGGEMVEAVIRREDPAAPVVRVRATRGKAARAEPVSILYEKGLVRHVGRFPELEDQLVGFGTGSKSPDRVDALVWAVTELTSGRGSPRVRRL